jgi:sec-independent protein translocase protein TatA
MMLLGIGMTPMGLLILGLVVLLLFGKRLPEVMKGLGKSVTEFKKGINEATNEEDDRSSKS